MLNRDVTTVLIGQGLLNFLTNTNHVEPVVSCHLVFHTQVNVSHLLNLIESSYHAKIHYEHLMILNCKEITSVFHLLSCLQTTGETSRTPLLKNKKYKNILQSEPKPSTLTPVL